MKAYIVFSLIIFLCLPTLAFSQDDGFFECGEIEDPNYRIPPQRGGRYFTEQGVVKAMVVFVQFAGDTTNPDNPEAPRRRPCNKAVQAQ